jgi:hypothetical protein
MRHVSSARFPAVPEAAGHYESFYLKACHPGGGLGVWIRYTVHKRPHGAPRGAVWFTLFDATAGVRASKSEVALSRAGREEYIAMGPGRFAPGVVVGRATSHQLDAAWDLRFVGDEPPVWHLPARWMYRAPLPRTKVLSPHPHVEFEGWITADGRRIDLTGWPGTVGHNWGAEHAERAIWIHGANFVADRAAWIDLTIARVAVGPLRTPWIANGVLSLGGRRHRLGGLERLASTRVGDEIESCRFRTGGAGVRVSGLATAPRRLFVGWTYAQPSGGARHTINCSIADLRLEVQRTHAPPLTLAVEGGAAYEHQMPELYAEIPPQPFSDG